MTAFNKLQIDSQQTVSNREGDSSKKPTLPTVLTRSGKSVTCSYVLSPNYRADSALCQSLDLIFREYTPERNPTLAYTLRAGIQHLLDYVNLFNKGQPAPLRVNSLSDLSVEVFVGFINYILDQGTPLASVVALKGAIQGFARETGKIPLIQLPKIPNGKRQGRPPLSPEGFDTLEKALLAHVEKIREKLEFRKLAEAALPYTAQEIMDSVKPPATKHNIFAWYRHFLSNDPAPSTRFGEELLKKRLKESDDPELRAAGEKKYYFSAFKEIYDRDISNFAFGSYKNPFAIGFSSWKIDYPRAIKTLLNYGFPFEYDLKDITENYKSSGVNSVHEDCPVKLILYHAYLGHNPHATGKRGSVDDLMGLYYPTRVDMVAILIFMMFQSGWNKETTLNIDKDDFEHFMTGTVESAIKVVWSEKFRSQGKGKPFEAPKRISLPTRSDDPVSFYNLIHIARELSEPLAKYPLDRIPPAGAMKGPNYLFLHMMGWGEWCRLGRHTSSAFPNFFGLGVKHFLELYEVTEDGKRLTRTSELTGRLRPTWLLYKKKHNPIALLSMTMGHQDRDTTDIFYDNSAAAKEKRLSRLRSELEEVITLLRTKQFTGLLGKRAQADASAKLKIFHIPGKDKPLWGCANQENPDWLGSEIIASTGSKCFAIQHCIFCSQIRIFEDSLPYLMEREAHLSELLDGDTNTGSSRITAERNVIQFILDEWGDEDEIEAAARYRRYNSPLLPSDLSILEIIFESEDYNV
ncbi:MAG: hypothetical protein P0Y58_22275 [Candidatus Pseudomonas phytovorans]|uniref:Integrase n=1 Tax=Candidatus Pseudomonas phytovorans TaxID=3121377 RepID=A0AAJ5WH53_9PSED|nr:hypothetical protein [Pseudomonas sp.]WEK29593.1 MAG: hypothetical protein P0Y58_22275 [Pseudomonas sp.]